MRQKVVAYDLFKGKKKWNSSRDHQGNYLESAENKTAQKFKDVVQKVPMPHKQP